MSRNANFSCFSVSHVFQQGLSGSKMGFDGLGVTIDWNLSRIPADSGPGYVTFVVGDTIEHTWEVFGTAVEEWYGVSVDGTYRTHHPREVYSRETFWLNGTKVYDHTDLLSDSQVVKLLCAGDDAVGVPLPIGFTFSVEGPSYLSVTATWFGQPAPFPTRSVSVTNGPYGVTASIGPGGGTVVTAGPGISVSYLLTTKFVGPSAGSVQVSARDLDNNVLNKKVVAVVGRLKHPADWTTRPKSEYDPFVVEGVTPCTLAYSVPAETVQYNETYDANGVGASNSYDKEVWSTGTTVQALFWKEELGDGAALDKFDAIGFPNLSGPFANRARIPLRYHSAAEMTDVVRATVYLKDVKPIPISGSSFGGGTWIYLLGLNSSHPQHDFRPYRYLRLRYTVPATFAGRLYVGYTYGSSGPYGGKSYDIVFDSAQTEVLIDLANPDLINFKPKSQLLDADPTNRPSAFYMPSQSFGSNFTKDTRWSGMAAVNQFQVSQAPSNFTLTAIDLVASVADFEHFNTGPGNDSGGTAQLDDLAIAGRVDSLQSLNRDWAYLGNASSGLMSFTYDGSLVWTAVNVADNGRWSVYGGFMVANLRTDGTRISAQSMLGAALPADVRCTQTAAVHQVYTSFGDSSMFGLDAVFVSECLFGNEVQAHCLPDGTTQINVEGPYFSGSFNTRPGGPGRVRTTVQPPTSSPQATRMYVPSHPPVQERIPVFKQSSAHQCWLDYGAFGVGTVEETAVGVANAHDPWAPFFRASVSEGRIKVSRTDGHRPPGMTSALVTSGPGDSQPGLAVTPRREVLLVFVRDGTARLATSYDSGRTFEDGGALFP